MHDTVVQLLKTYFYSVYYCTQCIRGVNIDVLSITLRIQTHYLQLAYPATSPQELATLPSVGATP